ncbi:hypothetical protein H632_c297p1 [Helicosporidium sp. ATCC 50920]|nr:hypothetical protein H632_c297p1 [Helicosporidium sp. ATCC 50920]|eukprot:KDD76254.1 hypothetical protein H632_c297p1 [Helicosporidium sp. ATCC 50920]
MLRARLGQYAGAVAETCRRSVASSAVRRGLDELVVTIPENPPETTGVAWTAADLRRKSWDDLHGLWYVLLKERTRLHAEKALYKASKKPMPDRKRYGNVKLSMNRIKQVLSERIRTEHTDEKIKIQLKAFVNNL